MADYGHDLAFGTFLTPLNRRPQDVVALAQLTERAGLEFATFQDHPYQSSFLDTWTLLSWVAAQTTTLRVAPNVLNLPLRPPSVVARAAASLDLLSGGRVELGLGAGGFWDAIEAMGGRRLTPGQSVDALAEAVRVLRELWQPTGGAVRIDGEHHRVVGAKRGPAPAHDIELWLGAYKPRMLRLTGEQADGWLPSMQYLPREAYGPSNARIDEAAEAAGRDPRAIRRLLNVFGTFGVGDDGGLRGTPQEWVEQLLPLVLEHGFSTFFLATDDPEDIERFGKEVAPGLREAVATERARAGTPPIPVPGAVRGPAARAQRREGIDYDAVPASLAAGAVEPGDREYPRVRSTYVRRGRPGLVLRPSTAEEVAEAVTYARAQDAPLAVRSGGHGMGGAGTNDGGVVIDLGRLDGVEVLDPGTGLVRLGAGARWAGVAEALGPHGLALTSGDYGGVGVGGLVTAGGIGFLARRDGLTIDRVTAAEVVLADGSVVRAGADGDPELLWAVRGAGANFGVVTSVEAVAAPTGDVVFSTMAFDAADAAGLLERWGAVVEDAPRELTSFLIVVGGRGRGPVAQLYSVYAGDDTDAAVAALTPLLGIGPSLDAQTHLLPYAAVLPGGGETVHTGGGAAAVHNGLVEHLTPELAGALAGGLEGGRAPWVQIRSVGGAVNDTPADATAYAHRHQNFDVVVAGAPSRVDGFAEELRPLLDGLYVNFETDERPERLADAYPGATLARLRELKARYDPDEVFGQVFPITPAAAVPVAG